MTRHVAVVAALLLGLVVTIVTGLPGGRGSAAQGAVQTALVILLAAVMLLGLSRARKAMLAPLVRVREWAARIRQGDFSARLPVPVGPELRGLADDINRLAEWLESLADDQERQMAVQERRLAEKSRSLRLLYDVAAGISNSVDVERLLAGLLDTLTVVVGSRAAAVYLGGEHGLARLARIGDDHPRLCDRPDRSASGGPAGRPPEAAVDGGMLDIPLAFGGHVLGLYRLAVDPPFRLSDDLGELLTSLGRHLGMAIEKQRLDREHDLLSRMEERARLANELHDSLAQTLAGLRFQVRVLDDLLHQDDEQAIWREMERVEETLERANRELRELVFHFRAPVEGGGLVAALEAVVTRFRNQGDIQVFFQNQWGEARVPADWEVQILRIVQEALSNIRRHSGAQTARVLLTRRRGSALRVLVEDDGTGLAGGGEGVDHFGLAIMRERADSIGASLRIDSEAGEGTRVVLDLAAVAEGGPPAAAEQHS